MNMKQIWPGWPLTIVGIALVGAAGATAMKIREYAHAINDVGYAVQIEDCLIEAENITQALQHLRGGDVNGASQCLNARLGANVSAAKILLQTADKDMRLRTEQKLDRLLDARTPGRAKQTANRSSSEPHQGSGF